MRQAERGFLLLTSHLGDPACKPLTVAQFRTLINRMQSSTRSEENRDLTVQDFLALGYGTETAENMLYLLSRQEQLDYYVNQAAKWDCYPITRISKLYPMALRQRLG